jgi:phosphate transport system substrate-binding protein
MLSVITNENNPLKRLSMDQLSKIYKGEIKNWEELGGNEEKITLYGRQSSSGTYVFFSEHVVKGEYDLGMRNMEGNQAILESIRQDKTGIGYVGLGYISDETGKKVQGINVVDVSNENSDYISPLDKSRILDYPISRPLVQYLKKPVKNSEEYNFIMFELSDKGQEIVKQSGFDKILPNDKQHNDQIFTNI